MHTLAFPLIWFLKLLNPETSKWGSVWFVEIAMYLNVAFASVKQFRDYVGYIKSSALIAGNKAFATGEDRAPPATIRPRRDDN